MKKFIALSFCVALFTACAASNPNEAIASTSSTLAVSSASSQTESDSTTSNAVELQIAELEQKVAELEEKLESTSSSIFNSKSNSKTTEEVQNEQYSSESHSTSSQQHASSMPENTSSSHAQQLPSTAAQPSKIPQINIDEMRELIAKQIDSNAKKMGQSAGFTKVDSGLYEKNGKYQYRVLSYLDFTKAAFIDEMMAGMVPVSITNDMKDTAIEISQTGYQLFVEGGVTDTEYLYGILTSDGTFIYAAVNGKITQNAGDEVRQLINSR